MKNLLKNKNRGAQAMKLKKLFAILLSVAIIFCTLPISTLTASAETSGYYTYTVKNIKSL